MGIGGILRVRDGDHIIIDTTGLTNPGRIELAGGTVEYRGVLSNLGNGIISGRGTFRAGTNNPGGNGVSNLGAILLSGGTTDFHGDVNNPGSGRIIISGNAIVTFFDDVTHNGAEFRVSAGSVAVFFGEVTGSGVFTGGGAKFFEGGVSSPAFLATDGATTVQAPAVLTTAYLRESSLTSYGQTALAPGSLTSRLGALDLSTTGSLDLADNRLVLDLATGIDVKDAIPQVREYLRFHQLFSSTADADPADQLAVGYIDNALLNANQWGDLSVDTTTLLTRLTYLGDANLDGVVDADDFALIDKGYLTGGQTWWLGDFDYDRQVTAADYLLIDRVFLQQQGVVSPSFLSLRQSQFGADYVSALVVSVPEPACVAVVALAAVTWTRRRPEQGRRI